MEPLEKVARLAGQAADAREALDTAIQEARKAGAPLREVATAAGVSYETVRRICS